MPNTGRPWTAAEDESIRTLPPDVAARKVGRTVRAVHQRRYTLAATDSRRRWTAAEDRLLAKLPPAVAAKYLHRTPDSLRARRRKLGWADVP